MAVFDLVKNVSEIMMSALPNFWKIARGFLDGKYRKVRYHRFSKHYRSHEYPFYEIEHFPQCFTTESITG